MILKSFERYVRYLKNSVAVALLSGLFSVSDISYVPSACKANNSRPNCSMTGFSPNVVIKKHVRMVKFACVQVTTLVLLVVAIAATNELAMRNVPKIV